MEKLSFWVDFVQELKITHLIKPSTKHRVLQMAPGKEGTAQPPKEFSPELWNHSQAVSRGKHLADGTNAVSSALTSFWQWAWTFVIWSCTDIYPSTPHFQHVPSLASATFSSVHTQHCPGQVPKFTLSGEELMSSIQVRDAASLTHKPPEPWDNPQHVNRGNATVMQMMLK